MKKSLIALALMGAFSGAAFAQSNVTLYGILDVNVQRNDPDGNNTATTGVNSGHQSGNRWGVRGQMLIDAQTRDVVHDMYIRKVERVGGQLFNVEFDAVKAMKDPGKSK